MSAGFEACAYISKDFERLWTYIMYNLEVRPQKLVFGQGPYSQRLVEFSFGTALIIDCPLMKMMALFSGLRAAYRHIEDSADYMDMHITYSRLCLLRRFFVDSVAADFFQESLVYLGVSLQHAAVELLQKMFLREACCWRQSAAND